MYKIQKYRVVPALPDELGFLRDLAYNLYWTWDHDSKSLFHRLDTRLAEKAGHNPVLLLGNTNQNRLVALAKDDGYLSHLARVRESLDAYMNRKTWFEKNHPEMASCKIAYFSMEYGLAKGMPIYSGGLGILAADHLKSASDLGLPLVAIGLLYQHGYFDQYLARDGWQKETYPKNDFYNMPIVLVRDDKGKPKTISLDYPDRTVYAQIWRAQVGRIPLYLLDSNVPENSPEDKKITTQLYGGDEDMRIKQELLLGIGGIRLLDILGERPHVCHMNEGHSAFLALERISLLMKDDGLSFADAWEAARGSQIFTSHTPVPAGIDEFDVNVIDRYIGPYYDSLKITKKQFCELGGTHYRQTNGKFNMAIFAINMAGICNGVSELHGKVSRKMWNYLWPEMPEHEVLIGHITNGIHTKTWISQDIAELFDRYLGREWVENSSDQKVWEKIDNIPDEELWRTHERCRTQLVAFSRKRLYSQLEISNASSRDLEIAKEVLNPEALTIGFARRFAQYKRAYLLFNDLERLSKIVNSKDYPVQIILAGKAHPHDNIGKGILRDIVNIIRNEEFRNRIVLLENYDMEIASYLVQGVDVWLNTPRRPREASGTSGMKAGTNGVLNLSILDGWWAEIYRNDIGWAIGRGEEYTDLEEQDRIESETLYHLLETEVIPLFYKCNGDGKDLPREWIRMMKNSLKRICPFFNTNRMVRAYTERSYLPAFNAWHKLSADDLKVAKTLATWKEKIRQSWSQVQILKVDAQTKHELKVGEDIEITTLVNMDGLTPQDIRVEVYFGQLNDQDTIDSGQALVMQLEGKESSGSFKYRARISCDRTGQHGFSVRVLPSHPDLENSHEMGLITWYNSY